MILSKARHFAWLLRPDVRKATRSEGGPNEAFEAWWLACGRKEYPAFGALQPHQVAWLRSAVGTLDVAGMGMLPIPRAMQLVLQYRPDVRQSLGKDAVAMAAWFFASGLGEHDLLGLVDTTWVRELDRRVTSSSEVDIQAAAITGELPPEPNLLMALMWHLLPKAQQAAQSLHSPQGRWRFLASFFGGVGRSPALRQLLAPRWRVWLGQWVAPAATGKMGLQPRWQMLGLTASAVAWLDDPFPTNAAGSSQIEPLARDDSRSRKKAHGTTPGSTPQAASSLSIPASAAPDWRTRPFGVNLYGFAFGELGIGEDVRMAVEACEAAGIPYRVVNVDPGQQLRQADRILASKVAQAGEEAPFAFNVFCMPGFDMVGRVVMRDGPQLLQGHCNIGWWPWELPVWPQRWRAAFDLVDEVWASTTYTQATYKAATTKPVACVPLAVSVHRMRPLTRRDLGLPARKFLFLFIFDANSFLPRKNPQAVVEAFVQAFSPQDKGVGLIVKTMNGRPGNPVWDAFRADCAKDARILLLEQTMDREDVLGLVNACDAYVSLHRAEGFGRTLAEAMLLGKPVVATDFSGNTDFVDAKHGFPVTWTKRAVAPGEYLFVEPDDQAWWAEPDVASAATQMRSARETARRPNDADSVRAHAQRAFAPARVGQLMLQRLRILWDSEPNPWPQRAAQLMRWDQILQSPRERDLVSVIIPVLDNPRWTQTCLQSLHDQPAGVAFEVVCVDNGSGPVTKRLLAAWQSRWPALRVVTLETNHQFALGCNLGFQASCGARVVFLNNDTEVQPGWLASLVAPLDDLRVMAVQPKLVFGDGKLQCAGVVFSPEQDLGYPLYAGAPSDAAWVNRSRDLQAVTGACMAIRAADFAQAHGFDPVFINGHEDVDLCLRLIGEVNFPGNATSSGPNPPSPRATGRERVCRYEPASVVVHHEGRTSGRHAHLQQNRQTFIARWKGRIVPDDKAHYAADGFEVARYVKDNAANTRLGIAVSRPVLHRRPVAKQASK